MFDTEILTVSMLDMPLIFVVIGMVTFMRKLGLKGRWLLVASLIWGLVIGVGYQIAMLGVPATFAQGFAIAVYGLGLGLIASLFYDMLKDLIERSLKKLVDSFGSRAE